MKPRSPPMQRPGVLSAPSALASLALAVCALALTACAEAPVAPRVDLAASLRAEVAAARLVAAAAAPPAAPPAAAPLRPEPAPEPRFDLIVSGANARDVFLAMVADTRYSMLMHPDVSGTMSVTLRSVTVREALESIRDVYGYDFRVDGRRITVYAPTLQTRIFTINYPTSQRRGRSDIRVSSGAAAGNGNGINGSNGNNGVTPAANNNNNNQAPDNSQITTTSNSDFWTETADALRGLLGKGEGRAVFTSPQAGTIAVRAMPDELRQIEQFLHASQIAISRQVMLEAKIVEVDLSEGYQSGIDWSLLKSRGAIGQTSGGSSNALVKNGNGLPTLPEAVGTLLADSVSLPAAAGGTIGLSLATQGFQAVLGFLETNGQVQILSSPRVATMNNQKAVLKVGTDDYFVTNVTGGSITPSSGNVAGTTTLPSLTLTSFFSGIALDVTPQIDEGNMITLHLRPSVTAVTEVSKQIDLGTIGSYKLPLASSTVNETDTIVRVADGNIVAIGGLMKSESTQSRSGLPGSSENVLGRNLLGNNARTLHKKELVVLIKPTIIRDADDWHRATEQALAVLDQPPQRIIVVPPAVADARPAALNGVQPKVKVAAADPSPGPASQPGQHIPAPPTTTTATRLPASPAPGPWSVPNCDSGSSGGDDRCVAGPGWAGERGALATGLLRQAMFDGQEPWAHPQALAQPMTAAAEQPDRSAAAPKVAAHVESHVESHAAAHAAAHRPKPRKQGSGAHGAASSKRTCADRGCKLPMTRQRPGTVVALN